MKKYLVVLFIVVCQCLLYWKVQQLERFIRPFDEIRKANSPDNYFSKMALKDIQEAFSCLPLTTQHFFAVTNSTTDKDAAHARLFFETFRTKSAFVKHTITQNGLVQTYMFFPLSKPVTVRVTTIKNKKNQVQIARIENLCTLFKKYPDAF